MTSSANIYLRFLLFSFSNGTQQEINIAYCDINSSELLISAELPCHLTYMITYSNDKAIDIWHIWLLTAQLIPVQYMYIYIYLYTRTHTQYI